MGSSLHRALICVLGSCLLGGCAGVPRTIESYRLPTAPRGIVLVVDGAGGYQVAPRAVAAAVREAGLPLYVRSFDWTLGNNLGVADMTDVGNAQMQAKKLAELIAWYRANYPDMPIYVVAHSAGAAVALEAMQGLAPDSIERMILLAPAVAADYDLRRALAAARLGMDVFTSKRDRLYLGLGTGLVGTADGKRGSPAAGRVGFDTPTIHPTEASLLSRLRQHPWEPSLNWTGNLGDHAGSLRLDYLKTYVVPLFASVEARPALVPSAK